MHWRRKENIYQTGLVTNEDIHQIIKNKILNKYNISNGEEMIFQGENIIFFI